MGSIPTTELGADYFAEGKDAISLLVDTKLVPSRGEGRRLIQQGGLKLNGNKVEDIAYNVTTADFEGDELLIQKGKKTFHKVKLV